MLTPRRALLPLLLIFLMAGCSTPNIKSDYRLSPDNDTGLVIGSVTYSGIPSEYKMFYRRLPDGKNQYFKAGYSQLPVHSTDFAEGVTGQLFSAALPPGEYAFFGWGIGSGAAHTSSTSPTIHIPFTVKAGSPLYLGNFFFVPVRKFGLINGAKVYHSLKSERDLAVFSRKYPQIKLQGLSILETRQPSTTPLSGDAETLYTMPLPIVVPK